MKRRRRRTAERGTVRDLDALALPSVRERVGARVRERAKVLAVVGVGGGGSGGSAGAHGRRRGVVLELAAAELAALLGEAVGAREVTAEAGARWTAWKGWTVVFVLVAEAGGAVVEGWDARAMGLRWEDAVRCLAGLDVAEAGEFAIAIAEAAALEVWDFGGIVLGLAWCFVCGTCNTLGRLSDARCYMLWSVGELFRHAGAEWDWDLGVATELQGHVSLILEQRNCLSYMRSFEVRLLERGSGSVVSKPLRSRGRGYDSNKHWEKD